MRNLKIIRETSPASAVAAAGELLNKALRQRENKPVLLFLGGGSALNVLDFVGKSALSKNLTVTMTDERFSADPEANNFSRMQKTDFYALALEAGVSFFGTLPRPNEKIEELARRWEDNLKSWKKENPPGEMLALFGMGSDGHMAGIFPFPENREKFNNLFGGENWISAYNAEGKTKFNLRITTTPALFKQISEAFLFACGEEKKEKIDLLEAGRGHIHEFPTLGLNLAEKAALITDLE